MKGVLSVWLATGESYESLFPTVEEAEAALDALDLGPGDEAEAGPIPPGEVSRG